jgi:hypothetical protein
MRQRLHSHDRARTTPLWLCISLSVVRLYPKPQRFIGVV